MTRGKEIMQEAERMFPIDIQENLDEQSDMLLRQIGFKCGAKWADITMIDKACEWLKSGGYFVNNSETEKDFRKAMEE